MSVLASGYLSHGPAFKYIDDLNISQKENGNWLLFKKTH